MDESEQIMKRYLLGELSESERASLEASHFTDPQVFNQVLKTESELVDGYVRGQLSNEMRERFEQSYMAHPARNERVKFARALAARLDQIEAPVARSGQMPPALSRWQEILRALRGRRQILSYSIALATLLIMLAGVWIFVESRRQQQRELAKVQASRENQPQHASEEPARQQPTDESQPTGKLTTEEERAERSSPQQTTQPSPSPTKSSAAPPVAFLALNVGGVRSVEDGRRQTLVIRQGTTQARLLLNLKDDSYPSYRASLQMVGGPEIFSQTNLKPRSAKSGASFTFTVPTRQLASGDYVLTLRGINPNGEVDDLSKSLFRVEKR